MRLVTDLYEVSMAGSYLRRGMVDPATFSLFVRALPARRGFLVAAGIEDALDALTAFEITANDARQLVGLLDCDPSFVAPLVGMRFTGEAVGVPEGRIVLAGEPLLEVTAPLPQAQMVESVVLNAITYQTAIASKAARCVIAAEGRPVIDFALRRTHGVEAADAVARATALVGFSATSNVRAAAAHGLRATGTMAHSYVQAFEDEESAFRAFAADVPVPPVFLIDTYDVIAGIRTAIRVMDDLDLGERSGVRLDSGDLATGARLVRAELDRAGLYRVRIVASGGLDEHGIAALRATGAPVDVFAVGTSVGVSSDAPALDTAYKLVQFAGRPVLKLSPGKATAPSAKQVWRVRDSPGPIDTLALRTEGPIGGCEPLLQPLMAGGRRLRDREPLRDGLARFRTDLANLTPRARDLEASEPATCRQSAALADLTEVLVGRHRGDLTART